MFMPQIREDNIVCTWSMTVLYVCVEKLNSFTLLRQMWRSNLPIIVLASFLKSFICLLSSNNNEKKQSPTCVLSTLHQMWLYLNTPSPLYSSLMTSLPIPLSLINSLISSNHRISPLIVSPLWSCDPPREREREVRTESGLRKGKKEKVAEGKVSISQQTNRLTLRR